MEKESTCFLVRYDKERGTACAIKNEGEIRGGGINGTYFRAVNPPGFVNDLSGGPVFIRNLKAKKNGLKFIQQRNY